MYTVLVGKPGLGKSLMCINPAVRLLQEAGTANVLSDKLTIEYVLQRLEQGFPITSIGSLVTQVTGQQLSTSQKQLLASSSSSKILFGKESVSIISAPELSIFLKNPEDALPILNQLWDAVPGKFQYGTRGKGLIEVEDACQSLIAGSAPQYLVKSIPNDAVGGGFSRRVNFVFSSENPKPIYFPNGWGVKGQSLRNDLVSDLQHISSSVRGGFQYADQKAQDAFIDLRNNCEPEEFDDEATTSYKQSKWVHALKLAIALSASENDSMYLTYEHINKGRAACEEVAKDIGRVFRGVGTSDLVAAGDAVLRFVEAKGYATKQMILRACWKFCGEDDLDRLLRVFTSAEPPLLIEDTVGRNIVYKPVPVVASSSSTSTTTVRSSP